MPGLIDLTGRRFGRLTVLSRQARLGEKVAWLCLCDCGKLAVVRGTDMKLGKHQSCGCLQLDRVTRHGATHSDGSCSPEYASWMSMKARCLNPNAVGFAHYGGRGITICDRWVKSFEVFLVDMGPRPSLDYSLHRVDNDGPYCRENCRWATRHEQNLHRRQLVNPAEGKSRDSVGRFIADGAMESPTRHPLTYQGETLSMTEWARRYGLTFGCLKHRLNAGWPIEQALTEPLVKPRDAQGRYIPKHPNPA